MIVKIFNDYKLSLSYDLFVVLISSRNIKLTNYILIRNCLLFCVNSG